MSFSTIDYGQQSLELQDILKLVAAERKSKLVERLGKMTALDHFQLLKTVIKGHLGAKRITISYSVPDPKIVEPQGELVLLLKAASWDIQIYPHVNLLIISNYPYQPNLIGADYDEYPYTKVEFPNEKQTVFNFYVEGPVYNEELINRLIAFGDHIRIELWDLLIPKDKICKPIKIKY